jgi:REP element-mobilizing transposase RayT
MPSGPTQHHRRSIRLAGYDYTQVGVYFISLCAHNRQCFFGEIVDGAMRLNDLGEIVAEQWIQTGTIRQHEIALDAWVVMPNHFHGIVMIVDKDTLPDVGCRGTARRAPMVERFGQPAAGSLSTIVRSFKSAVSKHINQWRKTSGAPVWQRNYWEHIVRNETDLYEIRQYICNNPLSWTLDRLFVK